MYKFNIYRLSEDGTGSWAHTQEADSAAQALEQAVATADPSVMPEYATYVVVDPERNPCDCQVVFNLRRTHLKAFPAPIGCWF